MKRHKHSLSHYKLLTCNPGELIPAGLVEVLPGDTFQHQASCLVRVSPLLAPIMHPVQVRLHHYFIPWRLLWSGWEDFITNQNQTPPPTVTVSATAADQRVLDYLGVPPVSGLIVNDMALRAYNLVYNEYYRDQDLITEQSLTHPGVKKISWEKDYFTSSRPTPQKGSAVSIPLVGSAPVKGIGITGATTSTAQNNVRESGGGTRNYTFGNSISAAHIMEATVASNGFPTIFADLSSATGADVRAVRLAFALQRFQEARSRYGSRYTEYLRYLGVRPADSRLQRPEYLGGGKQTVSFSEVLQTAEGTDPVGDMKGHGISAMRSGRYRKFFEEHGYVLTLFSVRPKVMYSNGLHRKFSKTMNEEFFQKELEHVGQQEVYNREVYNPHGTPGGVFGYADRYREYREEPSTIAGEFRTVLSHWHLARQFSSAPALNQAFVECDPADRVYAVPSQHKLWVMVNHSIQARRIVGKSPNARII